MSLLTKIIVFRFIQTTTRIYLRIPMNKYFVHFGQQLVHFGQRCFSQISHFCISSNPQKNNPTFYYVFLDQIKLSLGMYTLQKITLLKKKFTGILSLTILMSSKWFKSSVFRRKRLKSLQMVILAR